MVGNEVGQRAKIGKMNHVDYTASDLTQNDLAIMTHTHPQTLWQGWVRLATEAMHALILLCFFCSTWWWRPRWLLAGWVPDTLRNRLLMPTDSDVYQTVYFSRFALTAFIVLILILWASTFFRGLGDIALDGRIWWIISLGVLVAWIWLSVEWATRKPSVAQSLAAQWLLVFIFVLVLVANGPPVRRIALTIIAGMIFQAVIGIAQSALQHEVGISWIDEHWLHLGINLFEFRLDPNVSGTPVIQSEGVRYLRAYGLTSHPNLLGGAMVMGVLASSWLWLRSDTRRVAGTVTALGLWALFLTFSRSSVGGLLIGLIVVFGLWWLNGYGKREAIVSLAIILILAGVLFYAFYQPLVNVRAGGGQEGLASVEEISVQSRRIYVEQARTLIREHVWRGIGIGTFPWASHEMLQNDPRNLDLRGNSVHNIYYLALAEIGLVGAILVGGTLATAGWALYHRWRAAPLAPEVIGLIGGVCAWMAIGWFEFFPWSLFPHQVLLWGVIAAVLRPTERLSIEDNNHASD